jgi:hypothetical protein
MFRPSINLPTLDHVSHHSQQWVTPEMGLKSTQVKGFLTKMMYLRQQEKLCHRCQLKLTTYSPSFPTWISHPRKCAPYLLNSPSVSPLPFSGFNNNLDRKSQSPIATVCHLQEINSQQFSPREKLLTGLTTRLFNILWA